MKEKIISLLTLFKMKKEISLWTYIIVIMPLISIWVDKTFPNHSYFLAGFYILAAIVIRLIETIIFPDVEE
jgi:hypothetical protein